MGRTFLSTSWLGPPKTGKLVSIAGGGGPQTSSSVGMYGDGERYVDITKSHTWIDRAQHCEVIAVRVSQLDLLCEPLEESFGNLVLGVFGECCCALLERGLCLRLWWCW